MPRSRSAKGACRADPDSTACKAQERLQKKSRLGRSYYGEELNVEPAYVEKVPEKVRKQMRRKDI